MILRVESTVTVVLRGGNSSSGRQPIRLRSTRDALDIGIASDDMMTRQDLLMAIDGHVLETTMLTGTYQHQERRRAAA